jgi:hypothetical protein
MNPGGPGDGPVWDVVDEHGIEPIEAWRAWRLIRVRERLRLVSPIAGLYPWPAGRPAAASCAIPGRRHRPAKKDCRCGLYAVSSREQLLGQMRGLSVVGTVSIWGRVIEHAAGYRAEFAYPQRVRLVCAVLGCRERWVMPHRVVRGAEILAVCSNHDDSIGPVASSVAEVQQQLLDEYGIDLLPRETFDNLDLTSAPWVCAP